MEARVLGRSRAALDAGNRRRPFPWLAEHFEYVKQPDRAGEMRRLAQHWKAIVQEIEKSNDRWSCGLLD